MAVFSQLEIMVVDASVKALHVVKQEWMGL